MNIENLVLRPGLVRDWELTNPLAVNQVVQADHEEAVALDLFIRNRGAAALTVATNGQPVITVDPGDVYTRNDSIMRTIEVVSAVQYDFQVLGIKFQTLKALGVG